MIRLLILALPFTALSAMAYDCPKFVLECQLKKQNSMGGYVVAKTITSPFVAFNRDEPSEEPNTCEAGVRFSEKDTGLSVFYAATVKEDLEAFLYVGEGYGAKSPQYETSAAPGKAFVLINGQQQMSCVLK